MKLRIAAIVPVIAVLVLLLGGCGKGELSRSDAQKAIEGHIRQNVKVATNTIELGESSFNPSHFSAPPGGFTIDTINDGENKRFRESDYVSVEMTGQAWGSGILWTQYKTAETERLRPYIVKRDEFTYSNARRSRLTLNIGGEVGKVVVTGVVKQAQNRVAAEFTYETLFNDVGQKLFQKPAVLEERGAALFILYDDGWRLTDVKTGRGEL